MRDTCLELYLARHAESLGNIAAQGGEEVRGLDPALLEDPPLSKLGEKQIVLLGERLSGLRFDAIFASPLSRAVRTAWAVAIRQPVGTAPVELFPDLLEVGTKTPQGGFPITKLQEQYSMLQLCGDAPAYGVRITDGHETQEDRLLRAQHCIRYFRERFRNEENILLCAHGTFNTYLIRAALGLPNENGFNFCQENTGLTKVKYYHDGKVRLSYMNDCTHLGALQQEITFTL